MKGLGAPAPFEKAFSKGRLARREEVLRPPRQAKEGPGSNQNIDRTYGKTPRSLLRVINPNYSQHARVERRFGELGEVFNSRRPFAARLNFGLSRKQRFLVDVREKRNVRPNSAGKSLNSWFGRSLTWRVIEVECVASDISDVRLRSRLIRLTSKGSIPNTYLQAVHFLFFVMKFEFELINVLR
jgi:hypothetical protein